MSQVPYRLRYAARLFYNGRNRVINKDDQLTSVLLCTLNVQVCYIKIQQKTISMSVSCPIQMVFNTELNDLRKLFVLRQSRFLLKEFQFVMSLKN